MDLATVFLSLDERERTTLELILAGQPNKVIGHRLSLSWRTVSRIRASILGKTGFFSFIELSAAIAKPQAADAGEFRETTGESGCQAQSAALSIAAIESKQGPRIVNDAEWRWLCCDLHDGAAQDLVGALKKLHAIDLRPDFPDEARAHLQVAKSLLDIALRDLREVIAGRSPDYVAKGTLVASIERLVHELAGTAGIDIDLTVDLGGTILTRPLETAIYCILQECLQNAIRHSGSKLVRVAIDAKRHTIRIDARDWGKGFDCRAINSGHLGLRSIWQRAELVKGAVLIDSEPGEGTHIKVELPLPRIGRTD